MTFYTEIAAEAKALLAEFGQDVTLTTYPVYDPNDYDVNTSTSTAEDPIVQSGLKAVVTNYKQAEIDGTKILQGDCKVIIESAATPSVNSIVTTSDSTVFTVIDFMKIAPSGEAVIYKLQVRK